MLTFDEETGNIILEIPDAANATDRRITIRPPKYGALKRLRLERENIGAWARAAAAELPPIPDPVDLDTLPDDEKETAATQDAEMRAQRARDRLEAITQINEQTYEKWWRLVVDGTDDGSFVGLGDHKLPANADDWPAELLVDHRDPNPVSPTQLQPSTVDRMLAFWGKARFRSGPRA